jgi:hypothetical protein
MAYGILRLQKYKASSGGAIRRTFMHSYREYAPGKEPDNIDAARSGKNQYSWNEQSASGKVKGCWEKYSKRLATLKNPRSDAVGLIEAMVTFSHDGLDKDRIKFFNAALNFVKNLYGKENFIGWAIHEDELTPHMHVFFMPIEEKIVRKKQTAQEKAAGIQRTETKAVLNAQKVMGDKAILGHLQDDFYNQVSRQFGLDRGQPAAETKRAHSAHTLKFAVAELDAHAAELDQKDQEIKNRVEMLNKKIVKVNEAIRKRTAPPAQETEMHQLPTHRHRPDAEQRGR